MSEQTLQSEFTTRPSSPNTYYAFISYLHADNKDEDRNWATWLHQQLEVYDVPAELIGTRNMRGEVIPERIYPVFRDEVSLPADPDLSAAIIEALDRSRFMIVLCSPRAVQSKHVADEILHFKATGKADHVMAALLLGEPNASVDVSKPEDPKDPRTLECFPRPLQYAVDKSEQLLLDKPTEPIAADFRLPDGAKGITNPSIFERQLREAGETRKRAEQLAMAYEEKINNARLKIIAGILGVQLDTLTERDKVYQLKKARAQRKRALLVGGVMSLLFIVAGLAAVAAWTQFREADKQQKRAESLLLEVRNNLDFMNRDLQDVLLAYVPTEPRVRVMKQIDAIVSALERHGGASLEDIGSTALAKLQKAELILQSASQDPAAALPLVEESLAAYRRLAKFDPGNAEFQYGLEVSYQRLGDVQLRMGDTDAALNYYQQALDMALKLVKLDLDSIHFHRDVSVSYGKLRDVQLRMGDTDAALNYYQQALDARLKLIELDPDNIQFHRDVSVSYEEVGEMQLRTGDPDAALKNYQQALDMALKLVKLDPENIQFRRDLSLSYADLGDVQLRKSDPDAALKNYQQALDVALKLVKLDPENTQFRRDLSALYGRLGDMQLRERDLDAARENYQQALNADLKLVQIEPDNTVFREDLSRSYGNLGIVQLQHGDAAAALNHDQQAFDYFQQALELFQRTFDILSDLVQIEPNNTEFLYAHSGTYGNLGLIQQRLGNKAAALNYYQEMLNTASKLVELEPENAQFQLHVIETNFELGNFFMQDSDPTRAVTYFRSAYQKAAWMDSKGILAPDDRWWIPTLEGRLAGLDAD